MKQDMFPTWSYSFVPWSVNREVASKPVLWICPRYGGCGVDHVRSFIAARAWCHMPSCSCIRAVLVGDSPSIQGNKLLGAWGGQRQGDPAWCPCGVAGLQKSNFCLPPWAVSPMFYCTTHRIRKVGCPWAPALSLWPTIVGNVQLLHVFKS